jgi:hypothetical protein
VSVKSKNGFARPDTKSVCSRFMDWDSMQVNFGDFLENEENIQPPPKTAPSRFPRTSASRHAGTMQGDANLLHLNVLLSQMDPFSSVALNAEGIRNEPCKRMRDDISITLDVAGMAPKPFSMTGKTWEHTAVISPSPLDADLCSDVTELFLSFSKLEESWAAIVFVLDLPLVSSVVCSWGSHK